MVAMGARVTLVTPCGTQGECNTWMALTTQMFFEGGHLGIASVFFEEEMKLKTLHDKICVCIYIYICLYYNV